MKFVAAPACLFITCILFIKSRSMKKLLLALLATGVSAQLLFAQEYKVVSPDKNTTVTIHSYGQLSFDILKGDQPVLPSVLIGMDISNGITLGKEGKVKKAVHTAVNDVIRPVVPIKNAEIPDNYNQR